MKATLPFQPSTTREECITNIAFIRDAEAAYLSTKHDILIESDDEGEFWTVRFVANGVDQEITETDPASAIIKAATMIEGLRAVDGKLGKKWNKSEENREHELY